MGAIFYFDPAELTRDMNGKKVAIEEIGGWLDPMPVAQRDLKRHRQSVMEAAFKAVRMPEIIETQKKMLRTMAPYLANLEDEDLMTFVGTESHSERLDILRHNGVEITNAVIEHAITSDFSRIYRMARQKVRAIAAHLADTSPLAFAPDTYWYSDVHHRFVHIHSYDKTTGLYTLSWQDYNKAGEGFRHVEFGPPCVLDLYGRNDSDCGEGEVKSLGLRFAVCG